MQSVERMAVVGDQRWLQLWLDFAAHFVPIEVRHFEPSAVDDAWRWLDA
jgi:hypothetical protein